MCVYMCGEGRYIEWERDREVGVRERKRQRERDTERYYICFNHVNTSLINASLCLCSF